MHRYSPARLSWSATCASSWSTQHLYSGWISPYDATRAGLLTGATEEQLATLACLFQGTSPYLNEMF